MNTVNAQIPAGVASPPEGYALFTARKWGDPILVAQGAYSAELRDNVGQFQVINIYVPETGNFSSITNFNKLTHDDLVNLARTQLIHFGHPVTIPLEQMRKLEKKPLDGFSLQQKMNWLYRVLEKWGDPPAQEFWGLGQWFEAPEGRYGTMVRGGQMLACTVETFDVQCKLSGEPAKRTVKMRKLLPFRRSDWGKTHTQYPWLIQKCTVAFLPKDKYSETPKGVIYGPVALDWRDFPFAGKHTPSAYYIPDDWMIPLQPLT